MVRDEGHGPAVLRELLEPKVDPCGSTLCPSATSRFHTGFKLLYPPLGDSQQLTFVLTILLLLLTTFVVFKRCQSARKIQASAHVVLWFGFLFCVCALIPLYVRYVRRVPMPAIGLEVPVSIGYQRTPFALQTYPQWSDWEVLHDRGPWEEQIQMLWTPHSIIVVRVLLWLSYTLTLACFLSVVCLAVYQHAAEEAPSKSERSAQ